MEWASDDYCPRMGAVAVDAHWIVITERTEDGWYAEVYYDQRPVRGQIGPYLRERDAKRGARALIAGGWVHP